MIVIFEKSLRYFGFGGRSGTGLIGYGRVLFVLSLLENKCCLNADEHISFIHF